MNIEKRHLVAKSINEIIENRTLDDLKDQSQVRSQLAQNIFNQESKIYEALNYQRNGPLALTFFGEMRLVSWNYAKSLQSAQAIVLAEQQAAHSNRKRH